MTPPRSSRPSGVDAPALGNPVVSAIDTPAPLPTQPPRRRLGSISSLAARLRPRRLTLSGQTIVVVFNPTARDGKVRGELGELSGIS